MREANQAIRVAAVSLRHPRRFVHDQFHFRFPSSHCSLRHAPWARPESIQGPDGRTRVDKGGRGFPSCSSTAAVGTVRNGVRSSRTSRASRRAVACDLRGMGESDPSASGDDSAGAMAAGLDAVTRAPGIRRFVLAGYSYGGAGAAAYAAAHPSAWPASRWSMQRAASPGPTRSPPGSNRL